MPLAYVALSRPRRPFILEDVYIITSIADFHPPLSFQFQFQFRIILFLVMDVIAMLRSPRCSTIHVPEFINSGPDPLARVYRLMLPQ